MLKKICCENNWMQKCDVIMQSCENGKPFSIGFAGFCDTPSTTNDHLWSFVSGRNIRL